jgi:hypothetical protein
MPTDLQVAAQPDGFRCCIRPRRGDGGGHWDTRTTGAEPDFPVDRLVSDLLSPCAAAFRAHTGPIVLEFPPFPREQRLAPSDFQARLARFLAALPREFEYAVELRDTRLLTPAYRDILRRHGIAHTFNYWSAMPRPADQAAIVPPEDGPFAIVRLLLRPGTWYEDRATASIRARQACAPTCR